MGVSGALHVVVLAAGRGRRMNSDLPKVLHELAGRPLLAHVVECAAGLDASKIHVVVAVGEDGKLVRKRFSHLEAEWVKQAERLGTGNAVLQAMPGIPDEATVLVLYGDVPLISRSTLGEAVSAAASGRLAMITAEVEDPTGYGRILRDEAGSVVGIVEEGDADDRQREVREINSGVLAAPARLLRGWLARLDNDNAQGERYLSDVAALAVADSVEVAGLRASSPEEVMGVNDRVQLARLERCLQTRRAEKLMRDGATLLDPARVEVRGQGKVRVGRDVCIDIDVILEGDVVLGDGVRIGPYSRIACSELGARSEVLSHCHIEEARIGEDCLIGPYARLRGGVDLDERVQVGNFVEVKKGRLGAGTKAKHLSYLGDSEIGRDVNIGAGTVTCNYDGECKKNTVIGDNAFIGAGVELVAPLEVGERAEIDSGSTVLDSVGPDTFTANHRFQHTRSKGSRRTNWMSRIHGTLACNYDGECKKNTVIGDNAFIGAGVELVAPLEVGERAKIGAGSTVPDSVGPDTLTLNRGFQYTGPKGSRRMNWMLRIPGTLGRWAWVRWMLGTWFRYSRKIKRKSISQESWSSSTHCRPKSERPTKA